MNRRRLALTIAGGARDEDHKPKISPEEARLAKGQQRSNREVRKPKKTEKAKGPAASTVMSAFAIPQKGAKKK